MPSAGTLSTATSSLPTSLFRQMATRGCSTSIWPATSRGLVRQDQMKDAGGTIAYMAPERLRALAADADFSDCTGRSSARGAGVQAFDRSGPVRVVRATLVDFAAHRADIYALGMVVLEANHRPDARESWDPRTGRIRLAGRTHSNQQSMRTLQLAPGVPDY